MKDERIFNTYICYDLTTPASLEEIMRKCGRRESVLNGEVTINNLLDEGRGISGTGGRGTLWYPEIIPENFEGPLIQYAAEWGSGTDSLLFLINRELKQCKRIDKETLKKYLDTFSRILRMSNYPEEQVAKALSAIGLFRYEFESRNDSYNGTFVLPEEVRNKLPEEGIYLEIGMGTGDNIITLAREKNDISTYGSDISPTMVGRAQLKSAKGKFFAADAQNLPIREQSVNVAIICNALDRIPTARTTIKQIGKLVKKGGYLVVAQCNPFQNEFVDPENGLRFSYVPKKERLESVDEAVEAAGLRKIYRNDRPFEWNVNTLLYGREKLDVNIAIGRKIDFENREYGQFFGGEPRRLEEANNLKFYLTEIACPPGPSAKFIQPLNNSERSKIIRTAIRSTSCKECNGELFYTEFGYSRRDKIGEGQLWCNKCDSYYPIR